MIGKYVPAHNDLTEREHNEAALRKSEEQFRSIFQNHAAVKLLIDPETGNIVQANDAAGKFYGWPPEDLMKMQVQEINTLGPEEVKAQMDKARALHRTFFEFRHRLADGSVRDVEVYSSNVEVGGKELLHSIVHDVTNRKQAEEKIAHFHDLMQYIIEHNNSAVAVHDRDLRYIYVSQRYLDDYGLKDKNIIGRYHYEVFPDLPEKWRDVHQKALAGEVSKADQDEYIRENGTQI